MHQKIISLLVYLTIFTAVCRVETLREVIVSHTDGKGVLQLFHMREIGAALLGCHHTKKIESFLLGYTSGQSRSLVE